MEDKLSEDKKEELRNIFCYFYFNDELTNVVPALINSFDFNKKMQEFYKNHEDVQRKFPNLYKNSIDRWLKKKQMHRDNNINLM